LQKTTKLKSQNKNIALIPLAIIYGLIISIRNWLFDKEIIRSFSFKIPIISVGNLAVGGTGKTPHTEFILSTVQKEWNTAMLSRGYMRKTNGFIQADENSNSQLIGDEPYQVYKKFSFVTVAVDEKRVHGVKKLKELNPKLELVILDDAFQHRYIQAGLSILLTDYNNLYSRDLVLPAGQLREWKSGSKRADIIIVTKCSANIKPIEMRLIETELKPESNQLIFFSTYIYDEPVPVFPEINPENWTLSRIKESKAHILLVAGIVNPQPILDYLNIYTKFTETLFFDDHHNFQYKDYNAINQKFEKINSDNKIILVTEKDASRLVSDQNFPESLKPKIFAIPIRVKILQNKENLFIQKIKNYVVENSRNS
jgi:tetraacyldisaccharide 4'-kinase